MPIGGTGFLHKWNEAEFRRLVRGVNGPAYRAVAAAAAAVEKVAKARCPVSPDGSHDRPPGYLRDSIGFDLSEDSRGVYADVGASAMTPDGYSYGLGVELGTKPHIIISFGDYPLRDRYGNVFGQIVRHPGTRAQPFLRPALDQVLR
jgi:hypothetical protein